MPSGRYLPANLQWNKCGDSPGWSALRANIEVQESGTFILKYAERNSKSLNRFFESTLLQQAGWLFNMWPPLITRRFPFFSPSPIGAMLPGACRMVTPAPGLGLNATVCFQGAKPLGCFNFSLLLLHYTFGWWVKQCQTCGCFYVWPLGIRGFFAQPLEELHLLLGLLHMKLRLGLHLNHLSHEI